MVEALIVERETNGPYTSLVEFCRRIDNDKINRRALLAMIKSGAMDDFGLSRRGLSEQLEEAMASADQEARAAAAGQNDMFGLEAPPVVADTSAAIVVPEWPDAELLNNEKEALGLYLAGHPFDAVRADAMFFVDGKLADLIAEPAPQNTRGERDYGQSRREVTVAGLVSEIRKRGNRVSVVIDDDSARMEISLFAETFQEYGHLLAKDEIVVLSGPLRYDDFQGGWTVNCKNVLSIDRVIESRAKGMLLSIAPNGRGKQLLAQLHDVLLPYRAGSCEIEIQYVGDSAAARLELGPEWSVKPSRELRDKLSELLGNNNVRLLYAPGREIM